jgi:hypothetical protein
MTNTDAQKTLSEFNPNGVRDCRQALTALKHLLSGTSKTQRRSLADFLRRGYGGLGFDAPRWAYRLAWTIQTRQPQTSGRERAVAALTILRGRLIAAIGTEVVL